MKIVYQIFLANLLFLLSASFGISQCCSGGVPISSNLGLSSRGSGALQFQVTYDYNALRDWFDNTDRRKRPNTDPIRTTHSLLLEINYDISNAFAVSTLFSLVRQERETPLSNSFTRNDGIGDAIVLLKYNFFHKNAESPLKINFGLGPKAPLGRNDIRDENTGLLLSADLQPGTGAWEIISWTFVNYQALMRMRPTFNVSSIITTRYNFPGLRNNDSQYYRFGHEVNAQLGVNDRLVLGKLLLDPTLMFRFRQVGQDRTAIMLKNSEGSRPNLSLFPNTGGTYVYINPSLGFNLTPDLTLRLATDLPLYRSLVGSQVTTSYKVSASIYYSLSLRKNKVKLLPHPRF